MISSSSRKRRCASRRSVSRSTRHRARGRLEVRRILAGSSAWAACPAPAPTVCNSSVIMPLFADLGPLPRLAVTHAALLRYWTFTAPFTINLPREYVGRFNSPAKAADAFIARRVRPVMKAYAYLSPAMWFVFEKHKSDGYWHVHGAIGLDAGFDTADAVAGRILSEMAVMTGKRSFDDYSVDVREFKFEGGYRQFRGPLGWPEYAMKSYRQTSSQLGARSPIYVSKNLKSFAADRYNIWRRHPCLFSVAIYMACGDLRSRFRQAIRDGETLTHAEVELACSRIEALPRPAAWRGPLSREPV